MASPLSDKTRPWTEPALVDDEKRRHDSSTPTLYDETLDDTTSPRDVPKPEDVDDAHEWVTGWKLTSLMISITIGAFLMLLDMSIIATVRLFSSTQSSSVLTSRRRFLASPNSSIPWMTLVGMAPHTTWPGILSPSMVFFFR